MRCGRRSEKFLLSTLRPLPQQAYGNGIKSQTQFEASEPTPSYTYPPFLKEAKRVLRIGAT